LREKATASVAGSSPPRPTPSLRPLNSQPSTLNSYLLAGGGSGGHLFPGVALAEELTRRNPRCRILFAGSGRGIDRTVLAGTRWEHAPLPVRPPSARHPISSVRTFTAGLRESLRLIDDLRPAAVIGLGGFASVPVGLAARLRRIPLILLEQNAIPGRATSLLSRWADRVCVSFEPTIPLLPKSASPILTGNPVRDAVRQIRLRRDRTPTLLILGGSQGAAGVNAMTITAIARLKGRLAGWRITHQTGERDAPAVRDAYAAHGIAAEVAPFFPDLPTRYAEATLAISRAGATTLAELACAGLPAILVPYPRSVRDHQQRNAEHFASAGAAAVVPEGEEAADRLAHTLASLLEHPTRLAAMSAAMRRLARPDAAGAVADLILPRAGSERLARPAA
jgi:UDP-N-acetylglucosamine--N-acetylmuramyl-(pentapeptide) pyrophosphoryl-undecaprenol N-acetylglucosamine transferase